MAGYELYVVDPRTGKSVERLVFEDPNEAITYTRNHLSRAGRKFTCPFGVTESTVKDWEGAGDQTVLLAQIYPHAKGSNMGEATLIGILFGVTLEEFTRHGPPPTIQSGE